MSFVARLQGIEAEIQRLRDIHGNTGSVALLFAGEPVHGSRSIAMDFATSVLKSFQDLIAKRIASDEFGRLGARGRISERTPSTLAIRELVRGSVGFVLEDTDEVVVEPERLGRPVHPRSTSHRRP